jgi:pimeloyl-ACP methyl ester carboxylesterase
MPEYSIGPIRISGYDNVPVKNRLFRHSGPTRGLAVLFPGLRYTCDMPLFFYSHKILLEQGYDVLQIRADYTQNAFETASPDRQIDWLGADAQAAIKAASEQREYLYHLYVAKSIGTLALSILLLNQPELRKHPTIWLTPLFRLPLVEQAMQQISGPALYIAGTHDNTFDADRLAFLQKTTSAEALVFKGANHSLEIPGDLQRSLDILKETTQRTTEFLRQITSA